MNVIIGNVNISYILSVFTPFVIINLIFILILILSERFFKISRRFDLEDELQDELSRKLVHFLAAIVIITASYILSYYLFLALCIEALLALIVSKKLNLFSSVHKTREIKRNSGIYFYIIGIIVSSIVFKNTMDLVRIGILLLGISDSLASIAGKYKPIIKYNIFSNKSISGSFAFFLTAFIIIISYPYSSIGITSLFQIFILSLTITLFEASSFKENDNLSILLLFPLFYQLDLLTNLIALLLIALIIFCVRFYLMVEGKLGKFIL